MNDKIMSVIKAAQSVVSDPSVAYALDLAREDYKEANARSYKGAAEVLATALAQALALVGK